MTIRYHCRHLYTCGQYVIFIEQYHCMYFMKEKYITYENFENIHLCYMQL
jgi:hypothetical protein